MSRTVKQKATINAGPRAVYDVLMDSRKHARATNAPAKVSKKVGGVVKAGGDYITAVNVELKPGKRIVQAWRGKNWPKGTWSIATFELSGVGGKKTRLSFTQEGVPNRNYAAINEGWRAFYWDQLNAYFKGKKK
jgi:activator of HSP90 ATPase